MKLVANVNVKHILEKEYEGTVTRYVQTIIQSENKGYEVVKIKILDELISFKVGDTIAVPVQLSAMNSQVFYTQNGKVEVIKAS